jgi:RimJ/RimL family protein N-acetyltransferase
MRHSRAGRPLDSRATEKWVQSAQASFGTDGTGAFAVVLSPTRLVIGYCGIDIGEDTGVLELDYGFSPSYWP